MRMKRLTGVGVFVAALLVVAGLIYSTLGQSVAVVADEAAAAHDSATASEEAQPTSVVIAGVEYPVNEYGLSYGDTFTVFAGVQAQIEKDTEDELEFDDLLAFAPDLVEAKTNEGEDGYITAEDYLRGRYFALYQNKVLDEHNEAIGDLELVNKLVSEISKAQSVLTVYAADGTTEIGRSGYYESEGVTETKKYEDEYFIYDVEETTYPDGLTKIDVQLHNRDSESDEGISMSQFDQITNPEHILSFVENAE